MRDLRVFATAAELDLAVAEAVATTITSAVQESGRCSVALSGGSTPRAVYETLGTTLRDQIPWQLVHIFWGDERLVPSGDPGRNDKMAREMLLDKVPCPDSQIHPMPAPSAQAPDEAAREYEETMRQYFTDGRPRFDLVLLGLGAEGHTASIFPNSPVLAEHERWVRAVDAPVAPASRLTLTLPVLLQSAQVYFLVTGADKSRAFHAALDANTDPNTCPAAALQFAGGQVTWWVDAPAAGTSRDQDMQKGAVEGTGKDPIVPTDPRGANLDDSEVSNADEKGHTTDDARDEQR